MYDLESWHKLKILPLGSFQFFLLSLNIVFVLQLIYPPSSKIRFHQRSVLRYHLPNVLQHNLSNRLEPRLHQYGSVKT